MNFALRHRLLAAGLDPDAVNLILKAATRTDVPQDLADEWAACWDDPALQVLAALSPADRQHALARRVDDFLQDPVNRLRRATHAATQTADPDLRAAVDLAVDLADVLTEFVRDVTEPVVSPFTGKVRYVTVTDIDVGTAGAIIEVSTRHGATRKVSQLAVLLGPVANPRGLPVFHLLPNVAPRSAAARALRAAGSVGVYNDRAALAALVRTLP